MGGGGFGVSIGGATFGASLTADELFTAGFAFAGVKGFLTGAVFETATPFGGAVAFRGGAVFASGAAFCGAAVFAGVADFTLVRAAGLGAGFVAFFAETLGASTSGFGGRSIGVPAASAGAFPALAVVAFFVAFGLAAPGFVVVFAFAAPGFVVVFGFVADLAFGAGSGFGAVFFVATVPADVG